MSDRFCIVRKCPFKPVCKDEKAYTLMYAPKAPYPLYGDTVSLPFDVDEESFSEGREVWYCREHAVQYLFPMIDQAKGNTTEGILEDFARDDMM